MTITPTENSIPSTSRTTRDHSVNEQGNIRGQSFLARMFNRGTPNNTKRALEEIIDINRDEELFNNYQISMLNPEILYRTRPMNIQTQLIRINREERILVTNEPKNL